MISQRLPVIAGHHDERVVEEPARIEVVDQPGDLRILEGNGLEVGIVVAALVVGRELVRADGYRTGGPRQKTGVDCSPSQESASSTTSLAGRRARGTFAQPVTDRIVVDHEPLIEAA